MFIDFDAKPLPFFVYGSLLTGLHNHTRLLKNLGHHAVPGTVNNVDMFANPRHKFPYITSGSGSAVGEVIILDDGDDFLYALAMLDMLEGYQGANSDSNHYIRNTVTVHTADGEVEAYMYFASPETAVNVRMEYPKIPDGNWRNYLQKRDRRYAV